MKKYAWSHDGEEYYGTFDSHDAALDYAVEAMPKEGITHFYTAKIIDPKVHLLKDDSLVMADTVIEAIEELLTDIIPSDNEVVELITNKSSAKRVFGEAIIELVFKHCKLNRFGVTDVHCWGKFGS
jgi:hypothetical protein